MALQTPLEFFLQWHLTERCNLRCRHCYQSGPGGDELTLAEIAAVAAEAAEMVEEWQRRYGVTIERSCNVTGGEPLLFAELEAVLAQLAAAGFELYLLSNGTLIDRDWAQRLAACRVRGVQVSIEGPEAIHDQIRGRGSYRAALRGCRHLQEAGVPGSFNVTLSRINAAYLEEVLQAAAAAGVAKVGFARLVPSGSGAQLQEQVLAASEAAAVYRQRFALAVPGVEVVTGDPVAAQLRAGDTTPSLAGSGPCGGCAAGLSGLTILPDGTLLPCRRLEVPLGNVRRDDLREVWASSPLLCQLRDQSHYSGKCGRCPRWSLCRGCRAIAWAVSGGDCLAADPQCFL
jgi:radical SAM protein with 4Fe4S-binding SPASM domain